MNTIAFAGKIKISGGGKEKLYHNIRGPKKKNSQQNINSSTTTHNLRTTKVLLLPENRIH